MKPGTLFLIPGPLGDAPLEEVMPKGVVRVLGRLDTFIVEQPKSARALLRRAGYQRAMLDATMLVLDEHTRPQALPALLDPLLRGKDVGLLSEAGCPAVADPGAELVRLAQARGIRVVPLAGPSAILLALMASGLNGQRFCFHGYLPADAAGRAEAVARLERESRARDETEIFIETPYRGDKMFETLLATLDPATLLCLATDLTQPSESVRTLPAGEWKRAAPALGRRPTVFLIYAGK